jgi:hypothetical protein
MMTRLPGNLPMKKNFLGVLHGKKIGYTQRPIKTAE